MKLYKLTAYSVNETNKCEFTSREREELTPFVKLLEEKGFTCVVTEEEV